MSGARHPPSMTVTIGRRELLAALGGVAAWPLAARAQQAGKLPTIGFLGTTTPSAWSQWVAAFVQRLRDFGWIEGRTIALEYRWAEGRDERFVEIAAEFVQLKVDVIVTSGTALLAAKQATSVIPIVFVVANDPVGSGFVASLSRPGGNITDLSLQSTDLAGKRLELFREVVPDLRRLAIMAHVGNPGAVLELAEVQRPPARSALRSLRSKSGERRISPRPSRRSTAAWTHFISRPMRSYSPTGFASTPWLSPRDCRRCTVCGRMSKRAV